MGERLIVAKMLITIKLYLLVHLKSQDILRYIPNAGKWDQLVRVDFYVPSHDGLNGLELPLLG